MKIKVSFLKKILLILLNIIAILLIIKESKIIGFCCTFFSLISPIIFGYIIAWLIKPIMLKINKRFSLAISSCLTYLIFITLIGLIGYFFIPVVINEIKKIIPDIIKFYYNLPPKITNNIDINRVATKALSFINNCTINIKNIILNIFYSIFISYYFLISHHTVSKFIAKYIPHNLIYDISINLKAFVKGTLIDTIILFFCTLISFYIIKMPYSLLFAIIISITNIIPYIGPYIGGIPAVLVGFSISSKIGIIILITVILLQFIESTFIHPFIMSKSLNISPLYIIIGLIIFSYLFGVMGMLLSTPLVSVIKSCYLYYHNKKSKKSNFRF